MVQSPIKTEAIGEVRLAKTEFLGQKISAEKIQIAPSQRDENQPIVNISFKTTHGAYTARLKYHPTHYDERIEGWGGPLYLNGREVAVVLFENTTATKAYEDRNHASSNKTPLSSEAVAGTGQTQIDTFPYSEYQGQWILHSPNDQLIHITVQDKKEHVPAGAYFSVYEASEDFLGKLMHDDEMRLNQQAEQLKLHFSTLKATYQVVLNQDNETFFSEVWKGVTPERKDSLWTGYLQLDDGKKIPVYLEKMIAEKPSATTRTDLFLYDTENLDELDLVFTCQQASCSYDDKATSLTAIPLLKDWAIQSPYFYATAAGQQATIPTILFIHTKTGVWFVLNQRQASSLMFECLEFGKDGRLSSEEKICSPKNIPDTVLGDMVTQIENVEFWRMKSYAEKTEDPTSKQKLKDALFPNGERVN